MNHDSIVGQSRTKGWTLRTVQLKFEKLPKLMGILNVTPDSFSDGGIFFSVQTAIDQALRLEDEGADIIDIGGESTRPYSEPVTVDDELQRVIPVIEGLIGRLKIPISIDTTKASVAEAAIQLGAEIVNDTSGLEFDPRMIEVVRNAGVGVCAMHMQGTPQTMQENPRYDNVVDEILTYLKQRDDWLVDNAIDPVKICLDPGIGFGKTHEHNLVLLHSIATFHKLGRPLLVGHSRKGFIAKVINDRQANRTSGTVGVSLALALNRIQILRVHDVSSTRHALLTFEAAGGFDEA